MKLNTLIPLFCLFFFSIQAQDKLVFSYDNAGNQILRDRICLNCSAAKADVAKDAIPSTDSDEIAQDWLDEKFIASPNPVTDILSVEWINKKETEILQLSLYGSGNRLLYTLKPVTGINQAEFNFSRYPSGFYILLVSYSDGKTETYKILKK